jgi:LEA14-like dessication related protein
MNFGFSYFNMIVKLDSKLGKITPTNVTGFIAQYFWMLVILGMSGCIPKEQIEFRKVLNIQFEAALKTPVLKADVVFFNPNKTGSKLKKIEFDIFVNDKKAGTVSQTLNQKIAGQSEFTVPIEVNLALKELGLLDTLINLFGGKKYQVRLVGKIRVSVHGFALSVPVDYKDEIRIR